MSPAQMKADTQLDYAIFQLTPTRTRCELHVVAKGLNYKLASGLLKPFVSHLRAAEEQLARGGYSIRLEPPDPNKASWFTKGTMERFVRFVSTPEVLERVSSVEVELLELEETARQQSADGVDNNGSGQVDNLGSKNGSSQLPSGGRAPAPAVSEKSSKDGADNGGVEESSKQRLLRALDARRTMLQKEQGMAFARALAAGFNLESMEDLVLFADCFGASRLREACVKFLALCKKRQEAGIGLEDLELMAAESAHSEMAFMGALGGHIMWSDSQGRELSQLQSPNEGNLPAGEDGNGKLSRRGSLDGPSGASPRSINGHRMMGDGEEGDYSDTRGPAMVKGHPVMAAWQGQPSNQFIPGVHGQHPYVSMHPSVSNLPYGYAGPAPAGHPGLPYPHYPGSPYMPVPYPDINGWQPHSPLPPHYWPGQDLTDGSYSRPLPQQTTSTPSPNAQEMSRFSSERTHDSEESPNDIPVERSMRPARRSASPRRRSASPMRRVQIGRHTGSKRAGMVVIRNINYIASKEEQDDNKGEKHSDSTDSWSEDGESDEDEGAESVRASIEDAVGVVESVAKDGKRQQSKRVKKKTSSLKCAAKAKPSSEGDNELDGEDSRDQTFERKGSIDNGVVGDRMQEDGLFFNLANRARQQSSYDPTSETLQKHGGSRIALSQSLDMYEQEHQDTKTLAPVDDSYIIPNVRSSRSGARDGASMEPDFCFSSKLDLQLQEDKRRPLDDSFIVLDRSAAARESGNTDWRMPLNLEAEMPGDQNAGIVDSTAVHGSFEPEDMYMVPDRSQDAYKRAWNIPLDYDMQVLAADIMDNGHYGHEEVPADEDVAMETEASGREEHSVENMSMKEMNGRKLSEKDAKAKGMKDMLERRRAVSAGGRPGRPNPIAEAQLRAEKLRAYKADLQKSKKEREEEERKRIEDLKMQRQLRIAARSNPNGGPSSPGMRRDPRTPPLTASKSSPKVPNKLSNGSPLSPSVHRDRVANLSRVARPALAGPKSSGNAVSRSVSSLTELGKDTKKPTSVVQSSTGSKVTSHMKGRSENGGSVINHEKNSNGHGNAEEETRPKLSRTDEKVTRTNSGLTKGMMGRTGPTDEKPSRTESGQIVKEVGRTDSGRMDEKMGHRDSGGTMEKARDLTPKAPKRVAPQDALVLPVKPTRGLVTDTKLTKKAAVSASSKTPVQKKSVRGLPVAVSSKNADVVTSPSIQKEERKDDESSSHTPAVGHDEPSNLSKANGNVYASPAQPAHIVSSEEVSNWNDVSLSNASVIVHEEPWKEDVDSSARAVSITESNDRQVEQVIGSLVAEDHHAAVAHVSSLEDDAPAHADVNPHGQFLYELPTSELMGQYSPPFAPPTEYVMSPSINLPQLSPMSPQALSLEPIPTESPTTTRSRKKWGDSKAKGLKRLLLLGRKGGRSSGHNASDIASEGEEDDSLPTSGKGASMKPTIDADNISEQAGSPVHADTGLGSSSSKGSRSIFSLSTFRGKNTVKV